MSLSLGLLLAATVAVDLSSLDAGARSWIDADRLHGQLLVRLAEDGYGVRDPSGPTAYRVALDVSPEQHVVVRVMGAGERSDRLTAGPRSVLHLEIVQRVLLLLAELPPSPSAPAALPSVFVRFPARPDEEEANRVYGLAAVRLVEGGFELVGAADRASREVCISPDGALLDCSPTGSPLPFIASPDAALPAAAAGTAPTESLAEMLAADDPIDGPSVEVRVELGEPPDPAEWLLGASTGTLWRGKHVDPTIGLSARLGPEEGFCASIRAHITGDSPGGLEVFEAIAAAGPGGRIAAGRFTVEASVLAGVFAHFFWPSHRNHYRRWDWVVLLPLDLSTSLGGSWRFHGTAALGLAEEGHPVHGRDRTIWHRRPNLAAFDVGLSLEF